MNNPPSPLAAGETHVWSAQITAWRDYIASTRSILSEEELERHQRLMSAEKREQYLVSSSLTRIILAAYTNRTPDRIEIDRSKAGKPFLPSHELAFNLAHSGDQYLLAVSEKDRACGVDIQQIYPILESKKLLENILHPEERRYLLENQSQVASQEIIFSIWTAKEAYLKAAGTGMEDFPNWLCMLPDPVRSGYFRASYQQGMDLPGKWTVKKLPAPGGYQAAIAVAGSSIKLKHRQITPEDLDWSEFSSSYPEPAGSAPG